MKNCVFFRLMLACKWVHNATSAVACGLNTNKTVTFHMPILKNTRQRCFVVDSRFFGVIFYCFCH